MSLTRTRRPGHGNPAVRAVFGSYRVAAETPGIVAVLVAIRAVIWNLGVTGMSTTPLASSIIGGGVFVMGLWWPAPVGLSGRRTRAHRYRRETVCLLREAEAMKRFGQTGPGGAAKSSHRGGDLFAFGYQCRQHPGLSGCGRGHVASLLELEESDVPANYIVRLRSEQAGLRKSILRMYHIQREAFLPSAKAMITSLVPIIVVMLMFTDMGGQVESLVTLGFLSFFFVYLLRIINVIDKPFKVGNEHTDDDVSLFLLTEFVVQANALGKGGVAAKSVAHAEVLEQRLGGRGGPRRGARRGRRGGRAGGRRPRKLPPTWSSTSPRARSRPPANARSGF